MGLVTSLPTPPKQTEPPQTQPEVQGEKCWPRKKGSRRTGNKVACWSWPLQLGGDGISSLGRQARDVGIQHRLRGWGEGRVHFVCHAITAINAKAKNSVA